MYELNIALMAKDAIELKRRKRRERKLRKQSNSFKV